MDENTLRSALAGLAPQIRFLKITGSTNDDALVWAEAGALDGALVVADEQTSGRGRLGRRWVTQAGAALAFSVVLRPSVVEVGSLALFSPLGGVAVCQALQECCDLEAQIKWPNDVLVQRRKTAGILAEANWLGQELQAVVLGIGLNVSPASVPPAEELLFPATCVESEVGNLPGREMLQERWLRQAQPAHSELVEERDQLRQAQPTGVDNSPGRETLLAAILEAVQFWRGKLGTPAFLQAWEERLAFRGEWVCVSQPGQGSVLEGIVLGITTDGNLCLKTQDGHEMSVTAGDVHLRPLDQSIHSLGG